MISVILYGRNDNYGFNLPKRTANGLNCMAEALDDDDDEILFVDYNTPGHLPTLPEFIWDTLTGKALRLLKVIRISPESHQIIRGDSPLPILENVSRNAAIVRSNPANHWMLSTNPDVILILASRWNSLNELLKNRPDSFYEMPRFDVPESVWAQTVRTDPRLTRNVLREWVASNGAAVAETVPDPRFQRALLFDAPGDFQLAPREYFFRLHGFDESMNRYLHSDSNLAKRMWLLNGQRTDHLLGDLWVVHQDHYLSGEWAKNAASIAPNDYIKKVLHQDAIEANGPKWGMQSVSLPIFSLKEKIRSAQPRLEQIASSDSDLLLSKDIDWTAQPFYRLCRYDPELLTLYLREVLQLVKPNSQIVYIGDHQPSFDAISGAWRGVHPSGIPVQNMAVNGIKSTEPDILLVDFYHERNAVEANKVRLIAEHLERKVRSGELNGQAAQEELAHYTNDLDSRSQFLRLVPLWGRCFPRIRIRSGTYVVLLGCNTAISIFATLQEFVKQSHNGNSPAIQAKPASGWKRLRSLLQKRSRTPLPYFHHLTTDTTGLLKPLALRNLYMHHRLVITIAEPEA
jgi:hypothetical protein